MWLPGRLNARIVTVTNGEDSRLSMGVATPEFTFSGLNCQVHIHEDPATAARALLREGVLRHEVIRSLDTDADVLLVGAIGKFDGFPEVGALGVVLLVVKLLYALVLHVLDTIRSSLCWERAKASGQEVNDGKLDVW